MHDTFFGGGAKTLQRPCFSLVMSLRGIWVIYEDRNGAKGSKVVFSRRWLTAERRAKSVDVSSYYPIPSDNEMCSAILLSCSQPTSRFTKIHDSCTSSQPYPVYKLFDGSLWPVLCVQKNRLLLVTIPLIEDLTATQLTILASPSITTAIDMLDSIASIVQDDMADFSEESSKFEELYQFLCLCCPFGSPLDTNIPAVTAALQSSKASKNVSLPKVKKAAWQSGVYRGVSKLAVNISEEIKATLYDSQHISDTTEVNGIVQCKADLEGYPDILLTLTTPATSPPLDHLLTHPCVQSSDSELARQDSSDQRSRKLRFSAPIGQLFTLAHYQWSCLSFLPIRGFYQMKGDKVAKLLIQLKLHTSIKNNFEYFEVHIPFFNRGPIEKVDNIVPITASASLALSQDRKIIIWTIGQKFPNKGLEMSLQANVHFYDHSVQEFSSADDCFCIGATSYIDLFFKITDFTLSGCDVDTKSITLFPASKYKLVTSCELYSSQYRIWNSHGDALCTWSQLKNKS